MQKSEIETKFDEMCRGYSNREICKSEICRTCREIRKERFAEDDKPIKDKKTQTRFSTFSTFLIGFSNREICELKEGIDVLFVLESHGGGKANFEIPDYKNSAESATALKSDYLKVKITNFHQYEMRSILNKFEDEHELSKKTYFVTDLVKCYVKKKDDNLSLAAKECGGYLTKQIELLKPKLVVGFGYNVHKHFFSKKGDPRAKEGFLDTNILFDFGNVKYLEFYFPSQSNANRWIKQRENLKPFEKIKEKLMQLNGV